MKHFFLLLIIISIFGCGRANKDNRNENLQEDLVSFHRNIAESIAEVSLNARQSELESLYNATKFSQKNGIEFAPVDTASLVAFWTKLQKDLREGNKKEIIEVFNYPIRAYFLVLLQFAYDCDIEAFVTNSDKYEDVDIDKNNIEDYYDFVFTYYLKDMIFRTSVSDLFERGIRNKHIPGMTYRFFPRHFFEPKRNTYYCPNDHLLFFHIGFKNNRWSITIGGL